MSDVRRARRLADARRLTVEEAIAAGVRWCAFVDDEDLILRAPADLADEADNLEEQDWQRPWGAVVMVQDAAPTLDAFYIVYDLVENDDEVMDGLRDEVEELQTALDAWLAKYGERVTGWKPDYTRVVIVPPSSGDKQDNEEVQP